MKNYDLKIIKDKYGEKMMHLCREYFSTMLDAPGLLFQVLSSNFACSKFLYDDLVKKDMIPQFVSYIYSKCSEEYQVISTDKTPEELLASVGYTLFECHTKAEIASFSKYYRQDELLCTFAVDRLASNHVFFIVKDNVEDIKREDYDEPQREDEYSISVLSIQFTRGIYNRVSIKSRYNHSVTNSDSTYFNNLENIVPGLTKSFENKYHLNITSIYNDSFQMLDYVEDRSGIHYRYNYKLNNIYYCPNNIIINNGHLIDRYQEKEKYLIVDYFIIDLVNKKILLYDENIVDSFAYHLGEITKIEIYNDKEAGLKYIYLTEPENIVMICVNKYNQTVAYHNENIDKIANNFLIYNETLTEISLPNVRKIAKYFLSYNTKLKKIYAPNLKELGEYSLALTHELEKVEMPKMINQEFIKRRIKK